MRKITLTSLALVMATVLVAQTTDSVYIKPDVENGSRNFQIAYSYDDSTWTHMDVNLFESDYGPWGSEKKLYYPVLSYDGKIFHATFIPNPKIAQIATTQSDDLALWKPQDYPKIPEAEFHTLLQRQKNESENNIIRIPATAIDNLTRKKTRADENKVLEAENFVRTGQRIATDVSRISAQITIQLGECKDISNSLMGVFFEDISYAADGGLYAELIQNRDFEYTDDDHKGWDALTAWKTEGNGISVSIDTSTPLHANNAHYALLTTTSTGGTFYNEGWDGIALKKGKHYHLTMFLKGNGRVRVSLREGNDVVATTIVRGTDTWTPIEKTLTANGDALKARLVIEPLQVGTLALDFVSLFPHDTFNKRENGLRADLAQTIADLKPRFVRFPGGCATHGQGIDNIYHWQSSIGPLWERQPDLNIWHYHQTRGLGFYEYFQFCEDINAEPLPVLSAGVPCQNSWRGGNGQQGGIPFEKDLQGAVSPYTYNGKPLTMESYLQELLDLIEWANGDAKTSPLAAQRAKAGHPKPFHMKYLGIGNEDLISDVFIERYTYLIEGIRKAHPEITIVGTAGPFWEGSDYEYGWKAARELDLPIVDEHYYNTPGWFFNHRDFYDSYPRGGSKVYLGEWASKGNKVSNALVEAAYLTHLERNGDVVSMTSYAPLLAKEGHTNWNPDLIYFNNTSVHPTANYYVQRLFGQNAGDKYFHSDLNVSCTTTDGGSSLHDEVVKRIAHSAVVDSTTGDAIVKVVNMNPIAVDVSIDVADGLLRHDAQTKALLEMLSCDGEPDNTQQWTNQTTAEVTITKDFSLQLPPYSVTMIRTVKRY